MAGKKNTKNNDEEIILTAEEVDMAYSCAISSDDVVCITDLRSDINRDGERVFKLA
jgi:hypothetical protein